MCIRDRCGSVRWTASMQKLVDQGHRLFIELGPGKTLAGISGRICKAVSYTHLDVYKRQVLHRLCVLPVPWARGFLQPWGLRDGAGHPSWAHPVPWDRRARHDAGRAGRDGEG